MEVLSTIMLVLMIISSFALIAAILMLPPKGDGMGSSIGGESADLTLFGQKKSRGLNAVLEKVTIYGAVVFMASAFIYNVVIKYI